MSQHGPDEDPSDEANRALMGVLAGVAKASETALRSHRDRARSAAGAATEQADALDERFQVNGDVAERLLARIDAPTLVSQGSPEEIAGAWTIANGWADLDPQRFGGHAAGINAAIDGAVGTDAGALARLAGLDDGREQLLRILQAHQDSENSEESAELDVADREHLNVGAETYAAATATDPQEAAEHRERAAIARTAEESALDTANTHSTEAERTAAEIAAGPRRGPAAEAVGTVAGPGYDSPERRATTADRLRRAGAAPEAIQAHQIADLANVRPARQSVKLAGARAGASPTDAPAAPVALRPSRAASPRRGR